MKATAANQNTEVWSWPFVCNGCQRPYPKDGFPFRCPVCGGLFEFAQPLPVPDLDPQGRSPRGLARFRQAFPLPPDAPLVSLGEGGTPLIPVEVSGCNVYFKCEHLNPTGSFKDRGTAVLVSALAAAGVREAVEDSSGNAGASFAAYAAKAGIRAHVFVPAYASGPKRDQIGRYGAELVSVPGPRSKATEEVLRAVEAGATYASHNYMPHGQAGMATMAFEMVEQLGRAPGAVIMPVGQGTLLLGISRGFEALKCQGVIDREPQLVGVQAQACAPIWAVHTMGSAGLAWVREGETVAEGIRTARPLRGDAVLRRVEGSGGKMVAVEEDDILAGRDALSRTGFYLETTSAVVWPALQVVLNDLPSPIVVVLTGSGFKQAGTQ
ncbi:MAG: pyridoxal-phosphate dependent enzyme [Anaerolineales bacterium]